MVEGESVVDLWGGTADREEGRPWEEDTLQLIFSGTKGLVAICLLMLIDRGALDLDSPVASYWPEFAAAGKEAVIVRELVTHTARLPGIERRVRIEDLADDRSMAELLAKQPQSADPRAVRTYHALTYGWLCGELIRRIDGRSVGRFLAEEISEPMGLDLFIGVPEVLEARVSTLALGPTWGGASTLDGRDELIMEIFANPPVWDADPFPWNSPLFRQAEIPAVNAIGTARSIAKLYAGLDSLVSARTLIAGTARLEARLDPVMEGPAAYGVGFELQTEMKPFGRPVRAFGHTGAGGSCHGSWPAERVGFSYSMNLMRDDFPKGDPRPRALPTLFTVASWPGGSSDHPRTEKLESSLIFLKRE